MRERERERERDCPYHSISSLSISSSSPYLQRELAHFCCKSRLLTLQRSCLTLQASLCEDPSLPSSSYPAVCLEFEGSGTCCCVEMRLEGEAVALCPRACEMDWVAKDRTGVGHLCTHYAAERSHDHQPHTHEQHHHTNGQHHHHQHVLEHHQHFEILHEHQGLVLQQKTSDGTASCGSIYELLEAGSSRALTTEHERASFYGALLHSPAINMSNPCRLVVGYALTAKKIESFVKPGLITYARGKGIIFSVIDHSRPLVEQGPFDVILHKISGEVWQQQLKVYKQMNPKVFIFDPPEAIKKVYNRKSMLQEVADLDFHHSQGSVGVPRQLVVDDDSASMSEEVARENLKFPLVAKPLWIDGSAKSHALSLAFDEVGLSRLTTPLVLQEFVNHGGVMFKVYVVGHIVKVVCRPSLSDICGDPSRGTGVMAFPRVSSATASATGMGLDPGVIEYPPEEMLSSLAKKLSSRLGLSLFNLDMIRENGRGNKYYVIDINYFPGYGKVPDYEEAFTDFLSSLADAKESK